MRELFELKLKDFDLVIFDRYRREGVLPRAYFDNIANYVEQGGALLDSAGARLRPPPTASIARRSADVLPAEPTGDVLEQGFRPELTPLRPAPSRHLRPAGQRPAAASRPGAAGSARSMRIPRQGVSPS